MIFWHIINCLCPNDFLKVDVSRSAPDIKAAAAAGDAAQPAEPDRPHSPDVDGLKRRSESEPNLAKQDEEAP